jgi:prepilin-type N-terminal cleavage/methylation domain-containing protein
MHRRAFTLIELLVVVLIIIVVSAVALPTVLPALSHRQVSEGARLLQAQLAGARDAAIRDNAPRGIRLLPDPAFSGINPATGLLDPNLPLAANRIIPIGSAPDYREGRVTPWPGPGLPPGVAALPYSGPGTPLIPRPTWGGTGALMVYESIVDLSNLPNSPTSWFWNIRVGDQIQINNAGPWYTVVGPMVAFNSELFVNVGPPGTLSPLITAAGYRPEFLLLVNGRDDNQNGWKDEGWDGVDNDGINGVDDIGEWEHEAWLGSLGGG